MKSYDVVLTPPGSSEGIPYVFGPKGGITLAHTLKEPTSPAHVDTILIQSLHHGAGRKLATDPYIYRDTNGQDVGCDTRQIGMIMPGGKLTLIGTVAVTEPTSVDDLQAYAAVYTTNEGNVHFAVGRDLVTVDTSNDGVSNSAPAAVGAGNFFTGSAVKWNGKDWLGVCDVTGLTTKLYNATDDAASTSANFKHSWAVSTRNTLFWILNGNHTDYTHLVLAGTVTRTLTGGERLTLADHTSGVPELRWTDATGTDITSLDPTPDTGNVFGAFELELPKPFVTGMGVAGPFAVFASRGGDLWGFSAIEVFAPLTPQSRGGFNDLLFGGPMDFIGTWLLVPSVDGLKRFDPRSLQTLDISPATHQGSTPGIGTATSRAVQTVSATPTGAMVVVPWLNAAQNLVYLEMYQDGMFFHPAMVSPPATWTRVWGGVVTHVRSGLGFGSQLAYYFIASDSGYSNWKVYRYDVPTPAWSPGPVSMAAVSGLRTAMYTPRPPDVSAQMVQVRGYAQASSENYINVFAEIDDTGIQIALGQIETTGPFVLAMPPNLTPGRRFALALTYTVGNQGGTVPYIMLPLSIDYRYSPAADDLAPDYVTVKVQCSSDSVNKISGYRYTSGRTEAEFLLAVAHQRVTLAFGDNEAQWDVLIEDATAVLEEREDGSHGPNYEVELLCRRL